MDSNKVTVSKPKTAALFITVPLGTQLPTDASSELNEAFKIGYASEDGLVNENQSGKRQYQGVGRGHCLHTRAQRGGHVHLHADRGLNEEALKRRCTATPM